MNARHLCCHYHVEINDDEIEKAVKLDEQGE